MRLLRDYGAPPRADRWTRIAARGWRRSLTRLAMASPGIVDDGSAAAFRTNHADLVVEIDSPGRRPAIEQRRIQDYMEAGVGLVWVILAATRSATVYRADGSVRRVAEGGVLDGGDALPGLRVSLASLFLAD